MDSCRKVRFYNSLLVEFLVVSSRPIRKWAIFCIFADTKNWCLITESCRFFRECFKHLSIFASSSMFLYITQKK